jgi:hypothetical protein
MVEDFIASVVGFVRYARKAIVAAVVPVVSLFVTEVVADFETAVGVAIAAVVDAFVVYFVPNADSIR